MTDDQTANSRIAWLALGLFIAGLLLPFVLYAILVSRLLELPDQRAGNIAGWVGIVSELLALAFGVIGWRHAPGKIAGIGSGVLIGLLLLAFVAYIFL